MVISPVSTKEINTVTIIYRFSDVASRRFIDAFVNPVQKYKIIMINKRFKMENLMGKLVPPLMKDTENSEEYGEQHL